VKWLLWLLGVLAAAVALGLAAWQDNGYVLIGRGQTTVETSLTFFILVLVAAFAAGYDLLRLAGQGLSLPARMGAWRARRRRERAARDTARGLLAFAAGDWPRAERLLTAAAAAGPAPAANHLWAARAAQAAGDLARRDEHLTRAYAAAGGDALPVSLTQAELQLEAGQHEQALATLVHLREKAPRHPRVLALLARVYLEIRSFGDLQDLIPELRRRHAMAPDAIDRLEKAAALHGLRIAADSGRAANLREQFRRLPRNLRRDPDVLACHAEALMRLDAHAEAEALLREALERQWDARLAALYGRLDPPSPQQALARAEKWLAGRERHPDLLLALGRLAMRCQLWGKARAYLEAAAGIRPEPEVYRELGLLLEHMGETEAAAEAYRRGLMALATPAAPCAPQGPALQSPANSKASA